MSPLALDIEKTLSTLDPEAARQFELAVRAMLEEARRKDSDDGGEFDRLEQQERALRESLRQQGRQFSAGDRLTRDDLYDRHALR